jgi:hypothetical protein
MAARLGTILCSAAFKGAVLSFTVASLLGHSPSGDGESDCSDFPTQRNRYDVAGDCGAAGSIELVAMQGSCDLWVEGDEVALPRVGTRNHTPGGLLDEGNFSLYDPQVPRGPSCSASKVSGGALSLLCSVTVGDTRQTCTANLRRVP